MLHISMAVVGAVCFSFIVAIAAAAGAVALARWDRQSRPASVMWGCVAFTGAVTLMLAVFTFVAGAGG